MARLRGADGRGRRRSLAPRRPALGHRGTDLKTQAAGAARRGAGRLAPSFFQRPSCEEARKPEYREAIIAIDRSSGAIKHVITEHNNWVDYGNGRGGLHAYTYCGWLYRDTMEGAYGYSTWWEDGIVPDVCPHCVHRIDCEHAAAGQYQPDTCTGCRDLLADRTLGHPLDRAPVPAGPSPEGEGADSADSGGKS